MAAHSDLPPPYSTLRECTADLTAPESVVSNDNVAETLAPSFEDKDSRIGFIQKVLAITWLQILLVIIIMTAVLVNDYSFRQVLYPNYPNFIVLSTLAFSINLGLLIYCNDTRWKNPFKYMFLVTHPLSFAIFICGVTFPNVLETFFIAWIYFCMAVLVLLFYSVLALQTKIEFTTRTGVFIAAGLFIVFVCTVPFVVYRLSGLFYATASVFLLCVYILVDIQAMMAKDYRFVLTPSDFVKAALIIHIDYRYIITKMFNSLKSKSIEVLPK